MYYGQGGYGEQNNYGGQMPGAQQINIDYNKIKQLRFSDDDIQLMQHMLQCRGRVTTADMQQMGIDYERAQRVKYMFDIASGKISINTKDDLAKHYRRMFGKHRRIGITDLAVSKVTKVPRWAVVAGIKDEVYSCLNSNTIKTSGKLYDVEKVTSRVFVSTKNKLVIPYKYPMKIDNVLEVLGKDSKTGKIYIAFNKKYCRVCNRYIIVAALRPPELHYGMIEMICLEGTKLYIYAKNLGTSDNVTYNGGTARVYDYGIRANEIQGRVKAVAESVYKRLGGVYVEYIPANDTFRLLDPVAKEPEIVE